MNTSEQPKRIPRRAKKGKWYVKMYVPMPDWSSIGKIYTIAMAVIAAKPPAT